MSIKIIAKEIALYVSSPLWCFDVHGSWFLMAAKLVAVIELNWQPVYKTRGSTMPNSIKASNKNEFMP